LQAHESIKNALQDDMVRGHYRYVFRQRLVKSESKKKKTQNKDKTYEEFELENYKSVPIVSSIYNELIAQIRL